jgi:hypothetical protein
MAKRIILAGLLAGIAMYAWTFVAHMVLPLGDAGIKEMPNEPAVLSAMQAAIGETPGLYWFPGMGVGPDATSDQKRQAMKDYDQKLAVSPSGLLIYHPPGAKAITGRQLGTEFATELLEAFLLVFLLAFARLGSFGARFGFALVVGLSAAVTTNVSYWNWYGFSGKYTGSYMLIKFLSYAAAGLVAAAILKTAAGNKPQAAS